MFFLLKIKRWSMVKMSPKIKCFLALYSVGFWGGVPPAFENTSHDRYFPNKKSVVDVVFTEICPIHYPTLNEAAQWQVRPFIICSSSIISPTVNWAVFDEGPSDGFKIRISVWGVVRATENPRSKNLHQFFSKRATLKSCKFHPFWIQIKCMKLNRGFHSQKKNTAYFSFFFSDIYSSDQGKRNSLQCFFETLMIDYAQKSLGHSMQQNPRVDFLWTESTAKTRCFFYILKKKKKKWTKKLGNLVCVFLR